MTIKDCIDIVDNIKPNQYTVKDKVMWLSFIDEIIINEVLKTHEGYDGRYDNFEGYTEEKLNVPLIVPSPYDRLYTAYLKMKIDGENGETARYNNSAALYNTYMLEYRKHYNKTHMPINSTGTGDIMPPKKTTIGLSDAEYENLKRDLTYILTEYFSDTVSHDKLYDVVMEYAQNNVEMLKGKDGGKGDKGDDGVDGVDGVGVQSVTQTYESTESGGENIVTITLSDGTMYNFRVRNGEQGETGANGTSPHIEVTKIEGGYNMRIIDAQGEKEFMVMDGIEGLDYLLNEVTTIQNCFPSEAFGIAEAEYDAGLEQGNCDNYGTFSDNTKRVRTTYIPIGEGIEGKYPETAEESFYVRLFDENKAFIGNGNVQANGTMTMASYSVAARVSYPITFDSIMNTAPNVKYAVVVFQNTAQTVYAPADVKMGFTIPTYKFVGKPLDEMFEAKKAKVEYTEEEIVFWYDIADGYKTKGFLKLPQNYSQSGKAVPLIVFVHGSADVRTIAINTMTGSYQEYYNYLRDCGYAIFDCFGWGDKYSPDGGGNTFGAPTNRDCYRSGIEYVCDTYNIDKRNIFVACKSLGGLQAFSMYYDPLMPINAVGMLAPELDIFKSKIGYNADVRRIIAQELGFTEDTNNVLDFESTPTTEFYDYIEENTDKWVGIFTIFNGLPIKNSYKSTYYRSTVSNRFAPTGEMVRTSLGRPLKIWCADDDINVSPATIQAVIASLNNAGYTAQYRSMGTGTGQHHAVDNDANAPQTTDVTTKLGIHYDSVPTAYYELAQWFDTWLTN